MNSKIFLAIGAAALASVPAVASAQDAGPAQPYIGASAGYHDLGIGSDIKDDGAIFGGLAGIDVPIGGDLSIGGEVNYHIGTGAIDSEYGAAGRLAYSVNPNTKVYVRGGYQEVKLDLEEIIGAPVPAGIDTSDGDFLVGAGAEFGVGASGMKLRLGVDTVSFDSTRATAGLLFSF
ncbi:outer membrane beta-barrel protein [Altererythrobacter aquiaggeris]|uniref:outer membrane beta-barrel protein n=1 Tax=Aestuarierythrobacter aquiaggeris TaxID=1898396 RepID=UPI00301A0586